MTKGFCLLASNSSTLSPILLSWLPVVAQGHIVAMHRSVFDSLEAPPAGCVTVVVVADQDQFILDCSMRGLVCHSLDDQSTSSSNEHRLSMKLQASHTELLLTCTSLMDALQIVNSEYIDRELFVIADSSKHNLGISEAAIKQCTTCYFIRDAHPQDLDVEILQASLGMSLIALSPTYTYIDGDVLVDGQSESVFDLALLSVRDRTESLRQRSEFLCKLAEWRTTGIEESWESAYQQLLADIDASDYDQTGTRSVFGRQLRFDMRQGRFPLSTLKRISLKIVAAELLWILNGRTDADWLNDRDVHTMDKISSALMIDNLGLPYREGDCGPIDGFQLRHFGATYSSATANYKGRGTDQWRALLQGLIDTPYSRRHVLSLWNPASLDYVARPPTNVLFQFNLKKDLLNLQVYVRSVDAISELPVSMATNALLLALVAHHCGFQCGDLILAIGDCHVYNHQTIDMQMLTQVPHQSPRLELLHPREKLIEHVTLTDLRIADYKTRSLSSSAVPPAV